MGDVTQADRDAVQAFHRVTAARLFDDIKNDTRTLGDDLGDDGDLVQAFARHRTQATTTQAAEITALTAEVERLRKLTNPEWFYHEGYDGEACETSPWDVIDNMGLPDGKHVISVDCATPLPSIWYVVHVLTDAERDAADTDETYEIKEYASEADARQALGEQP